MKISVVVLILCALGCTQAQLAGAPPAPYGNGPFAGAPPAAPGRGPFGGVPPSQFFSFALQAEAQKLLRKPDLPQDLVQRVMDTLTAGEQGYANCSAAVVPWLQVRCAAIQMKLSKSQLKGIEYESSARAQAANMDALLQSVTAQNAVPTPTVGAV